MAKLSDIAKVLIELRTAGIAKANFGIPMIAAVSDVLKNRAEIFYDYNTALEYTGTGGAKLEQAIVDAVNVAFSQNPRIDRIVVGKLDGTTEAVATLDASAFTSGEATDGDIFAFSIDGVSFSHTAPKTPGTPDTKTIVLTELASKITANTTISGKYTVTPDNAAGTLTVDVKTSGAVPPVLAVVDNVSVVNVGDLAEPIANQLNEIQGYNNSWYGFSLVGMNDADALEAAAWAEAADPAVQFFYTTNDTTVWSVATTDIMSELQKLQRLRSLGIASKNVDKLESVAEMCRFYVGQPGQIIAGLKTLGGVTPTTFTPAESAFVLGKNGNMYEEYADNTYLLNPGKAASGEWFDVVRDRDWLIDDIQKSVAYAMIRASKIPYTNAGITIIFNVLQGRLKNAQKQGVIAPDQVDSLGNTVPGFVITVPNAADIDADTKKSRVLTMSFVALLAGAIQKVEINGVLTYTYEG